MENRRKCSQTPTWSSMGRIFNHSPAKFCFPLTLVLFGRSIWFRLFSPARKCKLANFYEIEGVHFFSLTAEAAGRALSSRALLRRACSRPGNSDCDSRQRCIPDRSGFIRRPPRREVCTDHGSGTERKDRSSQLRRCFEARQEHLQWASAHLPRGR